MSTYSDSKAITGYGENTFQRVPAVKETLLMAGLPLTAPASGRANSSRRARRGDRQR